MKKANRRQFLKSSALMAAAPLLGQIVLSQSVLASDDSSGKAKKAGGKKYPEVDPKDPMAVNNAYYKDVKDYIKEGDSKKNARIDKDKLKAAKTQKANCTNCVLYATLPGYTQNKGKDNELDSCAIFAGKVVRGQGMCNTWAKKG